MSIYIKDKNGQPVKVGAYTNIDNYYDKFWDTLQLNGRRIKYAYVFGGGAWAAIKFNPKYIPIVLEGSDFNLCSNMFSNFRNSPEKENFDTVIVNSNFIDFSKATEPYATFENAVIDEVDVDFSSASRLKYTFRANNGGNIPTIRLKINETCTDFSNGFDNAVQLKTLEFKEGSIIAGNKLNLSWSTKLTHDSLMNVINALKDYSSDTSGTAWKVTFGATNLAKLTEAEKQIMTDKGWDYE